MRTEKRKRRSRRVTYFEWGKKGQEQTNKDLQIRMSPKLRCFLMHICKCHMRGKKWKGKKKSGMSFGREAGKGFV